MGPSQNFLTRVTSGQIFVARVGSGQQFLVWVWIWKIPPKNVKFSIFCHCVGSKSTRVRAGLTSYLLRVKSMSRSGQGLSLQLLWKGKSRKEQELSALINFLSISLSTFIHLKHLDFSCCWTSPGFHHHLAHHLLYYSWLFGLLSR